MEPYINQMQMEYAPVATYIRCPYVWGQLIRHFDITPVIIKAYWFCLSYINHIKSIYEIKLP